MIINRSRYKEADPERYIKYAHPSQKNVEPALSGRLAYLCQVKGETVTVTRGCVTSDEQKAAGDALLAEHSDYYRDPAGAVRKMTKGKITKKDPMMASAPGDSNHEFKQADDIPDDKWFRIMTNKELEPFGLYKPMDYEPWHVQCIETKGVPKSEIKQYFLNGGGDMDPWAEKAVEFVKKAQTALGIPSDGKAGNDTNAKFDEAMKKMNQMENDIRVARGALDKYGKENTYAG